MALKIVIRGTDMYGNEIEEAIDIPNAPGETSQTVNVFQTFESMRTEWVDERGKLHVVIEPPPWWKRIFRKVLYAVYSLIWFFKDTFSRESRED